MVKVQKTSWLRSFIALFSLITLLFFSVLNTGYAQFWTENFGVDSNCDNQGQVANGWSGSNGTWTVENIDLGIPTSNGPTANVWYVSATAAGINGVGCSSGCITDNTLTNQTLHIGTLLSPEPDYGAIYIGSTSIFSQFNTAKRVESPVIDCTGQYLIELEFNYVAAPSANDKCSLFYFDGTAWTDLGVLPHSGTCPDSQYSWDTYQVTLPASANNNPDVKIGFLWQNNSDGQNNGVSVIIDDIKLTAGPPPAPPVTDFETQDDITEICEQGCITFINTTEFDPNFSEGASGATFEWTFLENGNIIATSDEESPTICFDNPGTKTVTLTVTDNIGEGNTASMSITVLACGPDIEISVSQSVACANEECIDFTDLSTSDHPGGVTDWLWTITSPSGVEITSTLQNPTGICFSEFGFYDVKLVATDADLTKEREYLNYFEIIDCSGPDIDFEVDRTVICPGGCIQLTDLSTSTTEITQWNWSLPGGQAVGESLPDTSTQQNPMVCYSSPGTYSITLSAVDDEGPSAITKTINLTVDPCTGPPQVNFKASADTICVGDCVDFTDLSLGLVEDYLWVFQGTANQNDAVSTLQNPSVICYSEPGSYNVTLTVSNSNNQVDSKTMVDFIIVEQCINKPVPRIEVNTDTICAGKCVDFKSKSTGVGINSWEWSFQGAVEGSQSSTQKDPKNICYKTPGTYDVSLKIGGAGGDSLRVFNEVVTVIATPECRPTIQAFAPDTICAGDCAIFTANFSEADSVLWTFQGGNPEKSKAKDPGMICYEEEGNYIAMVEAWNASGSAQPQVFNVFVGKRPPLNAGTDKTINSGAVITLNASLDGQEPLGQFLWQPFDLVDDFRAQEVKTSPKETTQYIVYYTEPGTCTAIDTVTVFVNFVAAVGVPSVFSPNGDGQNDVLRVLGQGITRMDFKVFNRYGQMVFHTKNQAVGWDGTHNGKELNPGTFVYTLDVTFAEGNSESYTGNVTLVK